MGGDSHNEMTFLFSEVTFVFLIHGASTPRKGYIFLGDGGVSVSLCVCVCVCVCVCTCMCVCACLFASILSQFHKH